MTSTEAADLAGAFALRYLLVTNVPCFVDHAGTVFLERSWHHDFAEQLRHLPGLTVACPSLAMESSDLDLVPASGEEHRFVHLKPQTSVLASALAFPSTARTLLKAVTEADVVQSGVAGWPYPLGWISSALAKLKKRKLVVIVESAPWRLTGSRSGVSIVQWIRSVIYERLAGWSCRRADVAFFTQEAYRRGFHKKAACPAYIAPASWIRDDDVLDDNAARRLWTERELSPPRFLFAGRLEPAKGVEVLLASLGILDQREIPISVDVIGRGRCELAVDSTGQALRYVTLRRLPPREYGPEFFELLDQYHALVVPSISDEQPRIVFDAAARALGAIASDTDGLRPHISDGATGKLVPPGSPEALASAIALAHQSPALLRQWGLASLELSREHTHTAMHATRAKILREVLTC